MPHSIVVPGDRITANATENSKLGPGLIQENEAIIAMKAGIVQEGSKNRLWLESSQKRVSHNTRTDECETNDELLVYSRCE